jgi:hypothetical protein
MRLLLALLCLLALATSASAECAWVVWAVNAPMTEWKTVAAYSAEMECKAFAKSAPMPDRWTLLCLPDTVDPRGPKGK